MLEKADAFGRFPTPVSDVIGSANLTIAPEGAFGDSLLSRIRNKAGKALKRALSKVLGLLDIKGRLVFIDHTIHVVKQTFIKLHETGHAVMPWQRDIYAVVEECEKTLNPEIADLFDREANVFASEVLFQLDSFSNEAADHDFGLLTPVRLSKKYGASIYSSIRRYVSTSGTACTVLVLNPPEAKHSTGFQASLRRVVNSPDFEKVFGDLPWPHCFTPDDNIGAMIPVGRRRMSGPRSIDLTDLNGEKHDCLAEAFTQTHQVFILIHSISTLSSTRIFLPSTGQALVS
ncbi:MAG: hypothetical protein KDI54_10730 [Gammaproteobacteria bacterium]|nr:hypothetical protein [Gammaproteobacteria bacterium]